MGMRKMMQKPKKTFSQFSVNLQKLALISFILLMFCSCQKKTETLKNTDFIPQSIISLSPASTEILFAVGAQNQIAAVSDLSDYPPETKSLPKVGGFDGKTLSLETILSFKPDFVYLTDGMHNFLIEQLEQNNIKYYISSSSSINDIFFFFFEMSNHFQFFFVHESVHVPSVHSRSFVDILHWSDVEHSV